MEDDFLPRYAEELIEGEPRTPLDEPRERRPCIIEKVWDESDRYIGLRVNVDEDFQRAYQLPGQYVTLSPNEFEPRFLVISNAPAVAKRSGWEFLVDRHTDLGRSIDPLQSGATLSISRPEGPGYPVDEVRNKHVVCFTTGSGIASIRPAIQFWAANPHLAPLGPTIYYGESGPDDYAYVSEANDWGDQGVRLFYCDGSLDESADGFRYVQHAFEADNPDLEDAMVFISGASVMKRTVISLLVKRGLSLDRIVTNV